jgi:hypothetical protein
MFESYNQAVDLHTLISAKKRFLKDILDDYSPTEYQQE